MELNSFINYLKYEKRYSQHTIQAYERDLVQFSTFIKTTYDISESKLVTKNFVRSWIMTLVEKQLLTTSIHRKVSSLKTYFKFLQKRGLISISPITNVILPKKKKPLITTVTQEGMTTLLDDMVFKKGYSGDRDKILLDILYSTGMRRIELINLKIEDVDFGNGYFKVLGKGNKERIIPFGDRMKKQLVEFIRTRKETFLDIVIPSYLLLTDKGSKMYPKLVYNKVKGYLANITTISRKSPHILRHSFATHLMDNDADMNVVKELLGHSSLASTQMYAHTSIERLKKVYEKTHPKQRTKI